MEKGIIINLDKIIEGKLNEEELKDNLLSIIDLLISKLPNIDIDFIVNYYKREKTSKNKLALLLLKLINNIGMTDEEYYNEDYSDIRNEMKNIFIVFKNSNNYAYIRACHFNTTYDANEIKYTIFGKEAVEDYIKEILQYTFMSSNIEETFNNRLRTLLVNGLSNFYRKDFNNNPNFEKILLLIFTTSKKYINYKYCNSEKVDLFTRYRTIRNKELILNRLKEYINILENYKELKDIEDVLTSIYMDGIL